MSVPLMPVCSQHLEPLQRYQAQNPLFGLSFHSQKGRGKVEGVEQLPAHFEEVTSLSVVRTSGRAFLEASGLGKVSLCFYILCYYLGRSQMGHVPVETQLNLCLASPKVNKLFYKALPALNTTYSVPAQCLSVTGGADKSTACTAAGFPPATGMMLSCLP